MHPYRFIGHLFVISLVLCWHAGCQHRHPAKNAQGGHDESQKATMAVTIGGKSWDIDPNLSYKAIGVWKNPHPRPLTEKEKERLNAVETEMQTLRAHLDELDKELQFLQRIEMPQIKIQYSLGVPPHLSSGKIIHLGEFPMEMENPTKARTVPTEE